MGTRASMFPSCTSSAVRFSRRSGSSATWMITAFTATLTAAPATATTRIGNTGAVVPESRTASHVAVREKSSTMSALATRIL